MQINNYYSQTSFTEKYPVERLLSCACEKPFIRKSDCVNLISSICKLRKAEIRDMLRYEDVFQLYRQKAGEYILTEVPRLKDYVRTINASVESRRDYIVSKALEEFGEEVDIERITRPYSKRKKHVDVFI